MKKTISIAIALMLVLSCALVATATLETKGDVTYWVPWVIDGKEVTQGQVTTSDLGIAKDHSSNWEIKAQDIQPKITETYMSPATVWTVDPSKEFILAFDVDGGSKVQIGFLHTIGQASIDTGLATVEADGSDLADFVKLEASVDGTTWTDLSATFTAETATDRTAVLYSGMTGYDDPLYTNVGDGTQAYNEFYFIAEATVPENATLVRFVYVARQRSNTWDPVVRDAAFTKAVVETSEPATESEPETPPTGDMTYIYVIAAVTLLGASLLVLKKVKA